MISSFFPGRIRLRFAELKNPVIAAEVLSRIKAIAGISNTELNPLTGSLLVEYDTKILPTEKLIELGKTELAKVNITLKLP
ncbi:MAG: ATPase P [Spirochaetaceae bacterium]|jgi:hypothetical protein|nr:ATPase P [Spirochaetaceae bacterium]